jgi:hypothetical protein
MMQPLTPHLAQIMTISGRCSMDISVLAAIGFTTVAVIGIIVLIFTAGGKKKDTQN